MKMLCGVCKLVGILVIIGAINWGLIALFNFNLVSRIFGEMTMASRVVYALVGVSGLMFLFSYFRVCPKCRSKAMEMK
jgi:uncharacterized membrane protein YuzA (DUF378 family)